MGNTLYSPNSFYHSTQSLRVPTLISASLSPPAVDISSPQIESQNGTASRGSIRVTRLPSTYTNTGKNEEIHINEGSVKSTSQVMRLIRILLASGIISVGGLFLFVSVGLNILSFYQPTGRFVAICLGYAFVILLFNVQLFAFRHDPPPKETHTFKRKNADASTSHVL